MGFAFIREGDTTSHGGRVLACSPENKRTVSPSRSWATRCHALSAAGFTRSSGSKISA